MSELSSSYDFAVNGRRTLRLIWVVLCNGFLLVTAAKGLLSDENVIFVVIGVIICAASAIGIVLELLKRKFAAAVNVATPAFATLFMATSMLWLPVLAACAGHPDDAAEAAPFLLIFSLVPLCLALITGLVYRVIDIEADRSSSTLGLR